MREWLQSLFPRQVYRALLAPYHYAWALLSALWYGFPARHLTVIGVTGTKGKSSVSDMLYTTLKDAGYKVAVASTIRFAIQDESRPNLFKMTLPGRGFIQKFLAEARAKGSTHAVIEITSESTLQFRHLFLELDALVFTNLQKEHIESHGSFEKYAAAKYTIGRALQHSAKRPRAIIANADDERSAPFLALSVEEHRPFSYRDASDIALSPGKAAFTYKNIHFSMQLPGSFTIMNALAVAEAAAFVGVPLSTVATSLSNLVRIPGRTERIDANQPFSVIVDYAHTPGSLEALYAAYPTRKICVLGNTGGGRDTWKRADMGSIADRECAEVILTDEDPYDEDPRSIVDAMAKGMKRKPRIIMDRRLAIKEALSLAKPGDAVLITGKGTDPYIMGPHGTRLPWSDADAVREELRGARGEN